MRDEPCSDYEQAQRILNGELDEAIENIAQRAGISFRTLKDSIIALCRATCQEAAETELMQAKLKSCLSEIAADEAAEREYRKPTAAQLHRAAQRSDNLGRRRCVRSRSKRQSINHRRQRGHLRSNRNF